MKALGQVGREASAAGRPLERTVDWRLILDLDWSIAQSVQRLDDVSGPSIDFLVLLAHDVRRSVRRSHKAFDSRKEDLILLGGVRGQAVDPRAQSRVVKCQRLGPSDLKRLQSDQRRM